MLVRGAERRWGLTPQVSAPVLVRGLGVQNMRTPRSHDGTDTCGVSPPANFFRCASPCEPLWPPVFVTAAGPRRRTKVGTDAEGVCPRCWSAASAYRKCERRGPTAGQTPAASVPLLNSAVAHLRVNRCGRRCLSPLLVRGAERRWGLTPKVSVPGVGPQPQYTEYANAAVPHRDRHLRRQSTLLTNAATDRRCTPAAADRFTPPHAAWLAATAAPGRALCRSARRTGCGPGCFCGRWPGRRPLRPPAAATCRRARSRG